MQYSIVNYKTVKENSDFRIDADYYHPEFLLNEKLLKQHKIIYFNKDFVDIKFGTTPKGAHFQERGIPFVRSQNFSNGFIDYKDLVYIKKDDHLNQIKSKLILKDILIAAVGATIGEIGFSTITEGNTNQNIARVRVKSENIYPEFLFAFLKSKYGQYQLGKLNTGNAQAYLNSSNIASLFTVELTESFQEKIQKLIIFSYEKIDHSKTLYSQAEQLLLSELGLVDWKPKHELAFIKNFSATQEAERFDAEYFQPKYEEIVEAVKKYKGGFDRLENMMKIKDKNFTPKDNEQYKYIELSNISSNGEINGYTENFGNELPSRARRKVQKNDLIVSSIEGSLESVALITEDWKNALCSTGFFAGNSDKINSKTLLVLLKTKVGQLQLKKGCKGTILTAIGKDELSKIVLPKIDSKTQEEIKKKISEMYETKKLSKSLLEIAKRGVEMAIEKDEQEAENWIEEKLKEIKIEI